MQVQVSVSEEMVGRMLAAWRALRKELYRLPGRVPLGQFDDLRLGVLEIAMLLDDLARAVEYESPLPKDALFCKRCGKVITEDEYDANRGLCNECAASAWD